MAGFQAQKNSDAPAAQADDGRAMEIAQDLKSLRLLAARFRHLAPTAQGHVLRAILGKREVLLESISTRLGRLTGPAGHGADLGPKKTAFAQALGEVAAIDRESQGALRKRAEETAAEIQKLRAGKKWRQSNTP
jgi:hypothetical protein